MYQPQLRLLEALMDFVNTGEMKMPIGTVFNSIGKPVTNILPLSTDPDLWASARVYATYLLELAANQDYDTLAHKVNKNLVVSSMWSFDPETKAFSLVPTIRDINDFAITVVLMAFCTPMDKKEESLGHRIRKCLFCEKYFCQKTRRPARFNFPKCRSAYFNQKRLENKTPTTGGSRRGQSA